MGLAKWIVDLNDDMMGTTKWPPSSKNIAKLIRKKASPDSNWPVNYVEVIKYFGKFGQKLILVVNHDNNFSRIIIALHLDTMAREMLKKLVDERLTSY